MKNTALRDCIPLLKSILQATPAWLKIACVLEVLFQILAEVALCAEHHYMR
jgi:hypothetical protein